MTDVAEVVFDRKDQLDKITASLIPGEKLYAVYDMKGGGTGFMGITNRRVIFYDKSFLTKHKAVVSIPYSKINSIAAKDEHGIFRSSSELILATGGGNFEFEFHGAEKAHKAHSLIVQHLT